MPRRRTCAPAAPFFRPLGNVRLCLRLSRPCARSAAALQRAFPHVRNGMDRRRRFPRSLRLPTARSPAFLPPRPASHGKKPRPSFSGSCRGRALAFRAASQSSDHACSCLQPALHVSATICRLPPSSSMTHLFFQALTAAKHRKNLFMPCTPRLKRSFRLDVTRVICYRSVNPATNRRCAIVRFTLQQESIHA